MLTRVQINKAINDKLKVAFPAVPIQSSDVNEGFARPSFFVSLETNRAETTKNHLLREMTCRILYFPSDRQVFKEEAYDVQDRLELLFGLTFTVGDRTITIGSAETDTIDKVLHFDFDFSFYEQPAASGGDNDELMQELVTDGL